MFDARSFNLLRRPPAALALALTVLAAMTLTGCAVVSSSSSYTSITVDQMDQKTVVRVLGSDGDATVTPTGVGQDYRKDWPTVVGLVHVATGTDSRAKWKLDLRGDMTHYLLFQTASVHVLYDGPLPEDLTRSLRYPEKENRNELTARLVAFMQARVRDSLTPNWRSAATGGDDDYYSRFLGVFEVAAANLRGHGRASFGNDSAEISDGSTYLRLGRPEGRPLYHIEMHGSSTLGPVPVL